MPIYNHKLGIIGGAGPYASALLYQSIFHYHYDAGLCPAPELMILNYPFTRGLTLKESSSFNHQLQQELQHCLNALSSYGVQSFVLACNTLHIFLKGLNLKGMHLISIPEAVMQTALEKNMRRLLLLGTQTTIQSGLYRHNELEIITPSFKEQQRLDEIIDRILSGIVLEEDSRNLSQLIKTIYQRENTEAVILGCTDLPVLHDRFPLSVSIPILDSIQIPAYKLIHH